VLVDRCLDGFDEQGVGEATGLAYRILFARLLE
jgi:hypothetical protein